MTLNAIDTAAQRMLAEQLTSQLAKTALPESDQQYSQLFAQTLADALAPSATSTKK